MKTILCPLLVLLASVSSYCQDLYNINHITTIELTFTESNWDQILDNYYANELNQRLFGTCVLNGVVFDSVGVKFKGNSTYNPSNDKNPLNIQLDTIIPQNYKGYETLKLANINKDPSSVREVLSYEIARKYMDAPLSNYAQVFINGNYYGLFSSSESIDNDFQQKHLNANESNTRFKCNPIDNFIGNGSSLEYFGTDSANYYDYYELRSINGWQDLIDLTNTICNNPNNIENMLDIDRAIWMMAFNNVLVNLDSYTGPFRQNYYLVKDNNDRMVPVLWDMNECLGGFAMINTGPPVSYDSLKYMDPLLRMGDTTWPLLNLIYTDTTWQKMYIAHCRTILNENFLNGSYSDRGDTLQALISDAFNTDPNAFYTYAEFIANLDTTVGFFPLSTVGITELMQPRATFLQNEPQYQYVPPGITNVLYSPATVSSFSTVSITADITSANYVYLGYRHSFTGIFTKTQMFDDGLHNDGSANDEVYGVIINVEATDLQYYIFAENSNAGMFSPERAEHEFYTIEVLQDIVINELMATNKTIAWDQNGDYDDWIELYNNSNSTISLDGYYITDDATDLAKWSFPIGATINAGGYLIVWADSEMTQGSLHANFQLSESGEPLFLLNPALTIMDEVLFGVQTTDLSHGRYPNGTGPFIKMYPTFIMENINILGQAEQPAPRVIDVSVFPNPARNRVTIKSGSSEDLPFYVYNITGQQVYQGNVAGTVMLDIVDWEAGLYLLRIGNCDTKKLIVY